MVNKKDKHSIPSNGQKHTSFIQSSCEEMYIGETKIGETKRNVAIRWRKHEKFNGESEPAKHLTKFPKHSFKYSLQATT